MFTERLVFLDVKHTLVVGLHLNTTRFHLVWGQVWTLSCRPNNPRPVAVQQVRVQQRAAR